jgi:hypothetical protein
VRFMGHSCGGYYGVFHAAVRNATVTAAALEKPGAIGSRFVGMRFYWQVANLPYISWQVGNLPYVTRPCGTSRSTASRVRAGRGGG